MLVGLDKVAKQRQKLYFCHAKEYVGMPTHLLLTFPPQQTLAWA